MTLNSSPVWFITATSSGFGKAIALSALHHGHRVIATARNATKISDLKDAGAEILDLDVVSPLDDLKKTVAKAHAIYGRIDILINAAGFILDGAIEEAT
jgi:NADP-dependent 3-hydroxy acid dehydrogenase YdfG